MIRSSPRVSMTRQRGAVRSSTLSVMFVLLGSLWLLWSGIWKPLLLVLGIASCLLTAWLIRLMARAADSQKDYNVTPMLVLRACSYAFWLLKEIVKSNLRVSWLILDLLFHPGKKCEPVLGLVQSDQQTDLGKVIYANSITLTPGTLSLDIRGDKILIHALERPMVEDLLQGEMNERVVWLEGEQ